jgi:RND family efflux transporter MFP subunit
MRESLLKWTLRIGAVVATIAVIGGLASWQFSGNTVPANDPAAQDTGKVAVKTVEVMNGSVTPTALAYGTVTSSPGKSRVLLVQHDGIFKRVNVRDGELVRAGQPLVTIANAVTNAGAYAQAKSALEFAQAEFALAQRRLAERLVTNDDVAAKRKALADAQLAFDEQAKLGGGAAEEMIRAPFDGVVSGLMAVAGDKVQANTGFGTVSSQTGLTVELMLQPDDAARVKAGAEVRLNVPSQGSEEIIGKLTSIGGVVDKDKRLVKGFADVPAATSTSLALGMTFVAHVDLPPRDGLVVPRSAILEDESGPYVFTISNGEAKKQNIKVLVESGDMALVGGFEPASGTRVAVSGNSGLQDGTPVEDSAA